MLYTLAYQVRMQAIKQCHFISEPASRCHKAIQNQHSSCINSSSRPTSNMAIDIGVFIPIGNNGWLISANAPQYKPSFALNKSVVQQAEHYGFDFALSMIKLRGFGVRTAMGRKMLPFSTNSTLPSYLPMSPAAKAPLLSS